MATVDVLDSFISYSDTGAGDPMVFLHGNPTSSYLWRNVIPRIAAGTRCLAPDLIGMGASGKPDIAYRFTDHARYLDEWFDVMELDQVVLVGHDWGGALGMDWAVRHSDRVRAIAIIETFLRPMRWSELPPKAAEAFRLFRSPEGEKAVLEDNFFIEVRLPQTMRDLTAEGLAAYRAPFIDPADRLPMLAWAREFPLDDEPADVVEIVERYGRWMSTTPDVPKLLMHVEPGDSLGSPELIAWAAARFAALRVVSVGPGGHQAPEDQPEAIASAINTWRREHYNDNIDIPHWNVEP
ncbi:haloalkane dehalogenase [Nocardia brasiliensis]|uniref:haloalkane dehalogenase n=1 Tax=Nocardia brasiliensis TaxID=37326 RepID=UPI003D8BCDD7